MTCVSCMRLIRNESRRRSIGVAAQFSALLDEFALRPGGPIAFPMTKRSPFRYFKTSPEIIRLAVMLYIRFPVSLRNVEDLLRERGIEISHELGNRDWFALV